MGITGVAKGGAGQQRGVIEGSAHHADADLCHRVAPVARGRGEVAHAMHAAVHMHPALTPTHLGTTARAGALHEERPGMDVQSSSFTSVPAS